MGESRVARCIATSVAVACAFSLAACGGGGSGGSSAPPPSTASSPCDAPTSNSVALVIDSAFASGAKTELTHLATDISSDLGVCVRQLQVDSATTAIQIRSQLQTWYRSANLQGAVLIGDIPAVQLGDYIGNPVAPYVTDSFYEVLDDAFWKDPDGNGIYNRTADLEGDGKPSL